MLAPQLRRIPLGARRSPMKNLVLVTIGILACAASQNSPVATIPRYRGQLTPDDARFITRMNYDPFDAPFAWLPTDQILIGHSEVYSSADVFSRTCAGSGFYWVSLTTGITRAVSIGEPACEAASAHDGAAADPQGRWIVYSASVPINSSRLFRLDLPSSRIDTLRTGCRIYHDQPAVSRDGRLIAGRGLCRDRNQDYYRIYVTGADGSGLRPISTSESASDEMPAWSPDGRHIVFQRSRGELRDRIEEISIQDLDGSHRRSLTRGGWPAWSPDGQWIAFLSTSSGRRYEQTLRIIRPDGTDERVVFESRESGTYSRGWGPIPEGLPSGPLVWSPDSRWIAFTRPFDAGSSVWRVEIASSRLVRVTAPDR